MEVQNDANLTVELEKCEFVQVKVSYLGYDLTKEGLLKNKDKITAIIDAPRPTTITELRARPYVWFKNIDAAIEILGNIIH